MLNKERLINEFIELVSVPCPSKDEKQEAELIMSKLRALGIEPEMDNVHEKTGGTCGNVWAYIKGNVPTAPVLFFEAHMDSVAPTTGTKVVKNALKLILVTASILAVTLVKLLTLHLNCTIFMSL